MGFFRSVVSIVPPTSLTVEAAAIALLLNRLLCCSGSLSPLNPDQIPAIFEPNSSGAELAKSALKSWRSFDNLNPFNMVLAFSHDESSEDWDSTEFKFQKFVQQRDNFSRLATEHFQECWSCKSDN
jgi:hypothetical protein